MILDLLTLHNYPRVVYIKGGGVMNKEVTMTLQCYSNFEKVLLKTILRITQLKKVERHNCLN